MPEKDPASKPRPTVAPLTIHDTVDGLSASLGDQIELLAQELRSRWRNDQRVGIEALGPAIGQFEKNDEQLLDLIYHEILIREEFGETPQLEDFTARFPQHAERLQRLFAVHDAFEEDAWGEDLEDQLSSRLAPAEKSRTQSLKDPSSTELNAGPSRQRKHWPRLSLSDRPVEPPPGYELLEEIGRGGMAVVFRARQQILNRVVALKMLLAGGVANQEVLLRIRHEAQAVAQLQHPGIVQIHEVGEHHGLPFLSLEYVAGGTLHEWLMGRPLPPRDAARLIEQLAVSTQFAHERGIVHRDLKPSNILLTERPPSMQGHSTMPIGALRTGEPTPSFVLQTKISDFGLARDLGSGSELTATGQVLGTPSYMAPEQATGACAQVSPTQDIYSLGAILYELLTGRPPFRGATLFDTLEQVRSHDPVPPRQLQPRIPRDIETICLKCLEKSPIRRYSSAFAMAEDLRCYLQGESISARPSGSLERSWKWVRRYPAVASLGFLVLMATVIGIAGVLWEAQRADRERGLAEKQRQVADSERGKAEQLAKRAHQERLNAEQQRLLAEKAQKLAEQQSRMAQLERTRAFDAQTQAEANMQRTIKVLNDLAVLGGTIRHEPRMQALSKRLFDDTLRMYDELEKEQGDNPATRQSRIIALVAAGDIHRNLVEYDKAEGLLRKAADLLEVEFKTSPEDHGLHYRATVIYWTLGVIYKDSGRHRESLAAFDRDLAIHEILLKQRPNNSNYETSIANILVNKCISLRGLGRTAEAILKYEEAISILRAVIKRIPDHYNANAELGMALHDYSTTLRSQRRILAAEEAFREAFEVRRKVHQFNTSAAGGRVMLARMFTSQGGYEREAGNYGASIVQYQSAFDLLATLTSEFPDYYEYHRDLINVLIAQLETCLLANDAVKGRFVWQVLHTLLDVSLERFSQDTYFANNAGDWIQPLAEYHWEGGHKNAASRAARTTINAYRRSLDLAQKSTPKEVARHHNNLAWALAVVPVAEFRELDKAVELARRAVDLSPDSASYHNTLGTALYYAGQHQAARESLLKSIQIRLASTHRSTVARLKTAANAFSAGDFESTGRELQSAQSLLRSTEQTLSSDYAILAMTHWRLGELDVAREVLRRAVVPASDRFSKYGPELRRFVSEARALIQPAASL